MMFPTPGEYALQAVRQLRADCDEAQADLMTENMTVMRLGYANARAATAETALEAARDVLRVVQNCSEGTVSPLAIDAVNAALDASASTDNSAKKGM